MQENRERLAEIKKRLVNREDKKHVVEKEFIRADRIDQASPLNKGTAKHQNYAIVDSGTIGTT